MWKSRVKRRNDALPKKAAKYDTACECCGNWNQMESICKKGTKSGQNCQKSKVFWIYRTTYEISNLNFQPMPGLIEKYTEECFPCTFVTFPYQAWERLRHIGKNLLVGGYTCFVKKGPVSFFKIMMTTNRAFNEGLSWPSRQSLSNCEPTPFHGRQKTNGKHMKGMFFAHLSISLS